jgi:hypothetical protein
MKLRRALRQKGDKSRQLPVTSGGKYSQSKATNGGKFVAAFCRFLPRDFRLCFFLPN